MSAYAYVNGEICCDDYLDCDVNDLFDLDFVSGLHLYKKPEEGYLFSFGVKECRLKYLFEIFEKLAKAQSLEAETSEWEYVEAYILIRYESDNGKIDCIEIRNGLISHRETRA
jgi:hypothetical protein